MQTDLIDRIYECSFVPELWPGVLDELAAMSDARGAQLFAVRDKVLSSTTSATLAPIFAEYVNGGWFGRCDRRVCLFTQHQPSFFVEHDFWTPAQIEANEIYRDFFRPRGLGWSASTGLAMPTKDHIVFTVERDYARGPVEKDKVEQLNALRPHLARAALVAARLSLRSVQGASHALAALGLPALVLEEDGFVAEANGLMAELKAQVRWRANDKVALADARANELLWAALPGLNAPDQAGVRSFPLRGADGLAEMVAHLVPIRRSAQDIFGRSFALLIVTPVTARRVPAVELLRSLFDLTPSEARVARGLATGDSLDDIAASGNVSRNTVRAQLQQVLGKMGCSRQAEVTALMANVALGSDATVH